MPDEKKTEFSQHPSGFLLINKPKKVTSFWCVDKVRKLFPRKSMCPIARKSDGGHRAKFKVGHTGTLDPFATGLLIIALGRSATRMTDTIWSLPKTYRATGRLGIITDTCDNTGETVTERDIKTITPPKQDEIERVLASFGTGYTQVPPAYSALKHNGVPLYKLARNNRASQEELEVIREQKKKDIRIYRSKLVEYNFPDFTIDITVSKGTYIRTLVFDIGEKLGFGATTTVLKRTAIGPFSSDHALIPAEKMHRADVEPIIISCEQAEEMITEYTSE